MSRHQHGDQLITSSKVLTVSATSDGTRTKIRIFTDNEFGMIEGVATGEARRRKGDPRDSQVGFSLAMARALRQLADQEEAYVAEALGE
jgi:hypothetical protein